jgi:hypothetical protein
MTSSYPGYFSQSLFVFKADHLKASLFQIVLPDNIIFNYFFQRVA